MTRINVGVHPRELPDKLLLAEHREITRIPNAITSGRVRLDLPRPQQFTLGKGHVRFFYFRIGYLCCRYLELLHECQRRGFNVTDKRESFHRVPISHWGDYDVLHGNRVPEEDRAQVVTRIRSKGFKLIEITKEVLQEDDPGSIVDCAARLCTDTTAK